MKRKKRILLLLMISLLIMIGGRWWMDQRAEKQRQDLLAVEKQSVKVLKQPFADIAEVKINEAGRNDATGSYGLYITMTNSQGQSVSFSYSFWKESNEIGSYSIENRSIQKKGVTLKQIKVIYTDGKEEKI